MNIFQSGWRIIRRQPNSSIAVVLILGITTALGYTITAVERGVRQSAARAADGFDLLVGAPGSSTSLLLATVYLRVATLDTLPETSLTAILTDNGIRTAAPLSFGDATDSGPLVGTTGGFFDRGKIGVLSEGRTFNQPNEAVVGYRSPAAVGSKFRPIHTDADGGEPQNATGHAFEFTVVGRAQNTGTAWDYATLVPIEAMAKMHYQAVPAVQALVISPRSVADAYRLRHVLRKGGLLAVFPAELLVEFDALTEGPRTVIKAAAVLLQTLVLCGILVALGLMLRRDREQLHSLPNSDAEIDTQAAHRYGFRRTWIAAFSLPSVGVAIGLAVSGLSAPLLGKMVSNWAGMDISCSVSVAELQVAVGQLIVLAVAALLPSLATPKL
jgi:putative ABC transport system permease protein